VLKRIAQEQTTIETTSPPSSTQNINTTDQRNPTTIKQCKSLTLFTNKVSHHSPTTADTSRARMIWQDGRHVAWLI